MKGIYIHIPFCVKKCKYCDFVSFPDKESVFSDYVSAVIDEMGEYAGVRADTVFIGGGTPTVLSAGELYRLIDACFEKFRVADDYEFTVEANPETLTLDKIKAMRGSGANRVSVGAQSFDDAELKRLGRIHDAKTAYNTICQLKENGFDNINVDLMTALPFQTTESLSRTLETALSLPVTHISAYSLIIEDGTPLEREYSQGNIELPDEDTDRDMYAMTAERLKKGGFKRYEISNFSRDGFECRHNKKYWRCEEYIGLGAAAHSYIDGKRFYNTSDLSEYFSGKKRAGETVLTERGKIGEFMIMGLRMDEGISEAEFLKRFGKTLDAQYGKELEKFIKGGFLLRENGRVFFTDRGRDVSNSVLCEFV